MSETDPEAVGQERVTMKLGQILLERKAISKKQLAIALWVQERWGGSLGRILLSRGYVSEEELIDALSYQLGIDSVRLEGRMIPRAITWLLTEGYCERYLVFPFEMEPETGVLKLAMVNPQDSHAISVIEHVTNMRIHPYLAGFIDLTEAIWHNLVEYSEEDEYYTGLVEELASEDQEDEEVEILAPEDSEYVDIRDSGRLSPEIIEIVEEASLQEDVEDMLPEIIEEKDLDEPLTEKPFRETGQMITLSDDLLKEVLDGEAEDTPDDDQK